MQLRETRIEKHFTYDEYNVDSCVTLIFMRLVRIPQKYQKTPLSIQLNTLVSCVMCMCVCERET